MTSSGIDPTGPDQAWDGPTGRVLEILTGTWRAQAVHTAVVLGLPDHVAAGHTDLAALADRAGATADGIERLMRLLVSMGVFAGSATSGYRLTGVGEVLRTGVPGSLRDLVRIYGGEFHQAWGAFAHAVRTGRPAFEQALGVDLRGYLTARPEASATFQRAMSAGTAFFDAVPAVFDFSGCATVVDVAGGSGALLATVLRAVPGTHGILADLPHAVPAAEELLGAALPPDRYDVITQDVFEQIPGGADAYLLSRVLQDWDDASCRRLLANCRAAMPDTASLLVVERVIPAAGQAGPEQQLPLLWDLHLLAAAGGRHRTLDGYRALLRSAGLNLARTHPLPLQTCLLVAVPAP